MQTKKITILVLCLAVMTVVSGCIKKQPDPVVNNNTKPIATTTDGQTSAEEKIKYLENGEIDISNWKKYYNKELGIEFMYPEDYLIKIDSEVPGFDVGKKRDIHVTLKNEQVIFSLSATSKDYAVGVGEGCCFYYSDEPLNTELDLDSVAELISDLEPVNLKKVVIDNQKGVQFYSLKSYVSIWAVDSVLLPYNRMDFTNLLITSPTLQMTEPIFENDKGEEIIKKELINSIKNKDYLKDDGVAHLYSLFNQILKTFKFTD